MNIFVDLILYKKEDFNNNNNNRKRHMNIFVANEIS